MSVPEKVLEALASLFDDDARARQLLEDVDFPAHRRPAFRNAYLFWQEIHREVEKGLLPSFDPILRAAAKLYPYRDELAPWRGRADTPGPGLEAARIRDLEERHQRLREMLRRLQAQYDGETRVEERMRLEPLLEEKKRDLGQVESEIRALESSARVPAASFDLPPPAVEPAALPYGGPPRVFLSYAPEDQALCDELAKHLRPCERYGVLCVWHDHKISAGVAREAETRRRLGEAEIVLLLVSPDFMASDHLWEAEMNVALELHRKNRARVVPILLRPTRDLKSAPFGHLLFLPRDGRAVTQWSDRDEAFAGIAQELSNVASEIS